MDFFSLDEMPLKIIKADWLDSVIY